MRQITFSLRFVKYVRGIEILKSAFVYFTLLHSGGRNGAKISTFILNIHYIAICLK